jgi:hypothetical protein
MSIVNGLFTYTFSFPFDGNYSTPAPGGYIYVRNGSGEETATWYELGGAVHPAGFDGHAALAEGVAETSAEPGKPWPNHDTRLLYSAAQGCAADGFRLPPGVLGIVSTPIDLQPVVAGAATNNGSRPWNTGDPPLRVRLNYSQDLLDRLGIDEHQLVVLHLEPGQRLWKVAPTIAQSYSLNWIAGAAQPFAGQGQIYALGYVPSRSLLPLIRR